VLSALLLALSLSLSSGAHAQADGNDAEARRLYTEARAAFEAGDFEGAVREFRRAYLLSPRPALLYNIGQAELRIGHDGLGLEAFEAFLRQAPADDPRRSEVEERIRMLRSMGVRPATQAEAEQAQRAVSETTTESTTTAETGSTTTTTESVDETSRDTSTTTTTLAEPHDGGGGSGVAPWIVLGGGGALLVAGAVLVGVAVSDAGRVTGASTSLDWSSLEGTASGAQTMWGVGLALLGVGAAAVAGGLVWGLLDGGAPASRSSARLRWTGSTLFVEGTL
jgi:tetratricopeptide (TPR) repeat protein